MNSITQLNRSLIAACGLYCSNCSKFKKGRCPGCTENTKASWCKIKSCCLQKEITNCSACTEFFNPKECHRYNNLISKVIEYFTSSDRSLCISFIRENGEENFGLMMTGTNRMSLPKQQNR